MAIKACKECKRLVTGEECPVCRSSKLAENWKGKIIILNPDKSELAKKLGIKDPGEYALRI